MIRNALLQSLRHVPRTTVCRAAMPVQRIAAPCVSVKAGHLISQSRFGGSRQYSAAAGLKKPEVEGRIMDLLKNFDKVKDSSKLSPTSNFASDLGLDSLDTVEVVMAIEEEFSIEIPDKEADSILSINQAVDYILGQPDAQ